MEKIVHEIAEEMMKFERGDDPRGPSPGDMGFYLRYAQLAYDAMKKVGLRSDPSIPDRAA